MIGSDIYSIEYEEYDDEALIKSIEEEPSAELETPEFVSQRVDLVVNEEETIRLPCLLERYVNSAKCKILKFIFQIGRVHHLMEKRWENHITRKQHP